MITNQILELKSRLASGVAPAMATPLAPDGYSVDTAVVPALVELLLGAGVKGLFVGGTTGEGILLRSEERKKLHQAAATAVGGRVPLILHVGANTTAETLDLAQHALGLAPDALAAVTPYYYGMDDAALVAYYQSVAAVAPEVPFLAYDIPHLAMNGVRPPLIQRLNEVVPNFAGVKTSNRSAQAVRESIAAAGPDRIVMAGNESIALGLLALGADGLISGLSTAVPEPFVALTAAWARGDLDAAHALQATINRVLALLPPGRRIGAIKAILAERGIPVGPPVPPRLLPPGDWRAWAQIRELVDAAAY
jgi:2-dehydro-3-deoxy-D-pentonate aldolase